MNIGEKGIKFIKSHEGCRLNAYPDPATGSEPITIGFGNTHYEDGSNVKMGDIITAERADILLLITLNFYANAVKKMLHISVNQNQFDSLISFSYNLGIHSLAKSTLLKKININPSDITIHDEFMKYNKSPNGILPGLIQRRKDESNLYFLPI